ncbi:MAG: AMMECR1 domain-containing protein [Pirellulaceae bacterium]
MGVNFTDIGFESSRHRHRRGVGATAAEGRDVPPRFAPLSNTELPKIDIEISVLTPARPIASPDEFIPGRHGIILKKGISKAVFLPQVATEQGWDRETTLTHLALKAGLGPNEWRRGAEFEVFEAIVFSEEDEDSG